MRILLVRFMSRSQPGIVCSAVTILKSSNDWALSTIAAVPQRLLLQGKVDIPSKSLAATEPLTGLVVRYTCGFYWSDHVDTVLGGYMAIATDSADAADDGKN